MDNLHVEMALGELPSPRTLAALYPTLHAAARILSERRVDPMPYADAVRLVFTRISERLNIPPPGSQYMDRVLSFRFKSGEYQSFHEKCNRLLESHYQPLG